ncbi:hypothetical protein Ahy_B08g090281 [Arachis hypogaea]|uniref:Leucine-rich repeat-containing N-terminal plant-type domain-containing protein n=1 Tax=Arachis hypogaea TaxID=3818 RepID=A0A444XZX9_ARAHY|nr:hypothetical protein Ahy_B08g090281 [Arachis hypogaea]
MLCGSSEYSKWSLSIFLVMSHHWSADVDSVCHAGGLPTHISDTIGVGVGVGNGGGGGVVWVGGGVNNPQPSGSSSESNLDGAYTALQAWKFAITDDPKKILGTWVGPNVCSYKEVFCDFTEDEMGASASAFSVVASMDLNHANFQGTLVKELFLLTDMSLFHLNSNSYFSRTIPQELFYKNLDALFLNKQSI